MSLYKIEISSNAKPILLFKNNSGKYLSVYSKRNPIIAARKWKAKVRDIIGKNPDSLIVGIGTSLLYEWPSPLLGKNLILLEPFFEELNELFDHPSLATLNLIRQDKNASRTWNAVASIWKRECNKGIFPSDSRKEDVLENFSSVKKLIILVNPNYERLFPALCNQVKKDWSGNQKTNDEQFSKTVEHFILQWKRNWFKNLFSSNRNKNIFLKRVEKKVNLPVLLLGAGPSLNDIRKLEKIKKIQNNCFCICSDTALPFALRNQITPDIVFTIDSGRGTFYHLWEVLQDENSGAYKKILRNIPLLTWPGGSSKFIKNYPGSVHYYLSSFPWDQFLKDSTVSNSLSEEKQLCSLENPGGNILSACMEFAFQFFSSKVFLFGVDIQNNKNLATHYRGSAYESFRLRQVHRLQSMENLNLYYGISSHFELYMKNLPKDKLERIYIDDNVNFASNFGVHKIDDTDIDTLLVNNFSSENSGQAETLSKEDFVFDLHLLDKYDLKDLLFVEQKEFKEYSSLFREGDSNQIKKEKFDMIGLYGKAIDT